MWGWLRYWGGIWGWGWGILWNRLDGFGCGGDVGEIISFENERNIETIQLTKSRQEEQWKMEINEPK